MSPEVKGTAETPEVGEVPVLPEDGGAVETPDVKIKNEVILGSFFMRTSSSHLQNVFQKLLFSNKHLIDDFNTSEKKRNVKKHKKGRL